MSAEPAAYVDSSAFVKLCAREAETEALDRYLAGWPRSTSSALLRVEGLRAAAKSGPNAVAMARIRLRTMNLMPIDDVVLEEAAAIGPRILRSLDAVHLASARQLGLELGVLVTYDRRLALAASELGLPVASPA